MQWRHWCAGSCSAALSIFVGLAGCGDDDDAQVKPPCSVADQTGCAAGFECQSKSGGGTGCFCSPSRQSGCSPDAGKEFVCEEVPGGNSGCFEPLSVTGKVFNLPTGA